MNKDRIIMPNTEPHSKVMNKRNIPIVSNIVINFNGRKYLGDVFDTCIDSILHNDYENFEVIIVDNNSSDNSINHIKEHFGHDSRIKIVALERNLGTTGAKNAGIKASEGKYVFLLNNDLYLKQETLSRMVNVLEDNPDIGILGCKLVYPNGKTQSTGELFSVKDSLLSAIYPTLFRRKKDYAIAKSSQGALNYIDYVIGAALMIRKALVEKISCYDEDYFMYTEEVDLAYRVKRVGYNVACLTDYEVVHYENATAKHFSSWRRDLLSRNQLLFIKKNFYGIKLASALMLNLIRIPIHFFYSILTRDKYPWEVAVSHIKAYRYVKQPAKRPS